MMSGYHLVDCAAMAVKYSQSFEVPPPEHTVNLSAGAMVKLIFSSEKKTEGGCDGERMWVEVDGRSTIGGAVRYRGTLANHPAILTGLKFGDTVEFGPEHVADIVFHPLHDHPKSQHVCDDRAAAFVEQTAATVESAAQGVEALTLQLRTQFQFLVAALTIVNHNEPGVSVEELLLKLRELTEEGYVKMSLLIAEIGTSQGQTMHSSVDEALKWAMSEDGKRAVKEASTEMIWDRMKEQ